MLKSVKVECGTAIDSSPASLYLAERSNFGRPAQRIGSQSVLLLSSSLLTDRMFIHTRFLDSLSEEVSVKVWATSCSNPRFKEAWSDLRAAVENFPEVAPFREFPHNYLRRLNEFAWDFRQRPPSRLSMMRHVRDKSHPQLLRALKLPARALALIKGERAFEDRLERLLLVYRRSPDAECRLRADSPAVVITTGPFQFEQPAVAAAARNLGIPILALIPSWDNLSTKGRMTFKYDGYLVWSEQTRRELYHFYPDAIGKPVYTVGAPQFDVFFQPRFHLTREEFCASQGLSAGRKLIVYAVGSPNFVREHHGALAMAERVQRGCFGDAQLIVRPHPIHDNAEFAYVFRKFSSSVVLQHTAKAGTSLTARSQGKQQITEWVNTFRHADVVINLSSTVTIDAAIFNRPVVNLDYDPEPGRPNQALVKDVNHVWTHFKPIAESGGVWLVNNEAEMVEAVKCYLRNPGLHATERRWIAEYVCGYLDGRCGERMAEAILHFVHHYTKRSSEYDK